MLMELWGSLSSASDLGVSGRIAVYSQRASCCSLVLVCEPLWGSRKSWLAFYTDNGGNAFPRALWLSSVISTRMESRCFWTSVSTSSVADCFTPLYPLSSMVIRSALAGALYYKPEGCGFSSWWGHWIFSSRTMGSGANLAANKWVPDSVVEGKALQAREADNPSFICEPIV
jgi:hypothetical protein